MILDSDEEEATQAASTTFIDRPEFENEAVEDAAGYSEVVQTLDLSLGTDVLHIAVPPLVPRRPEDDNGDDAVLSEKMVFAVTCGTSPVYVITLPLVPPSHDSKAREELRTDLLAAAAGKGKWGETLVPLGGQFRSADGVAITLSRDGPTSSASRGRSSTRIVVAAHFKDASGTLRLWDVPLDHSTDTSPIEPFQTEFLPAPLTSISFNPSSSHTTQLLVVASPEAVRIYDFAISSALADETPEDAWPNHGSWLMSLYPPFVRGVTSSCARKPIVGAGWISHGRAILTLLADGQWGIWDIEGAGPLGNGDTNSLFGKHNTGVRGAALTAFNATGQLEGVSSLRGGGSQRSSFGGPSDLIQGGRRDSLTSIFASGPERLVSVKGGVEVVQLPGSRGLASGEESAVLWIGGSDALVCIIPIVAKFWDIQVRRSVGGGVNLFSGAQPSRMVRVTDLSAGLLGERCSGVTAVPKFHRRQVTQLRDDADDDGQQENAGLPVEVLVRGESRLVFVQEYQDVETAPMRYPAQKQKRLEIANKPQEPVNAIIVQHRPDAPKLLQNFENLSIRPSTRGSVQAKSANLFGGSFAQSQANFDDEPMEYQPISQPPSAQRRNMGLEFMDDLDAAADAGYELDAEERDVEHEIMDIMELDSQLDQMEEERQRGTKRVFFEEG